MVGLLFYTVNFLLKDIVVCYIYKHLSGLFIRVEDIYLNLLLNLVKFTMFLNF